MKLNPYLHFRGNCAEALAFYARTFGAGAPVMMRYADAPAGALPGGKPADAKSENQVMHGEISFPGGMIMASDYPPGMPGEAQAAVSLSYRVASLAEGEALFATLGEGGTVSMPFGPTFWSKGFGMVRDRFGTHWMISLPAEPMQQT